MLEPYQTKRSWVTQRLANRFPPWARLRKYAQSYGQQMLEPFGRELENAFWWETYNLNNQILNMADLSQISEVRRLSLPSNYSFRTRHDSDSTVFLPLTAATGVLSDGTTVSLTHAYNNSLESFWYGVPSRIADSGESVTYLSVIRSEERRVGKDCKARWWSYE